MGEIVPAVMGLFWFLFMLGSFAFVWFQAASRYDRYEKIQKEHEKIKREYERLSYPNPHSSAGYPKVIHVFKSKHDPRKVIAKVILLNANKYRVETAFDMTENEKATISTYMKFKHTRGKALQDLFWMIEEFRIHPNLKGSNWKSTLGIDGSRVSKSEIRKAFINKASSLDQNSSEYKKYLSAYQVGMDTVK